MGEGKSNKAQIIWFLIGVLQTIIFGWVWNISSKTDALATDVATLKAYYQDMRDDIKDIKAWVKPEDTK